MATNKNNVNTVENNLFMLSGDEEKKTPYASKVFKMNHTDMEIGWNFLSDYLESYNKVLAGQTPTIYNSPNVVELDTGNFYREEQNEQS